MELTKIEIERNIRQYQERIQKAEAALRLLPAGHLPYSEFKKREKLKKEYLEEIRHITYLILLAEGALNDATV